MKTTVSILIFVLSTTLLYAQSDFEKDYPIHWTLNNMNDIEQTSDNGYIIGAGSLIKTDEYGDTTWTKTHFSSGQFSNITGVTQTNDGGYAYVLSTNTGTTWNTTLVKTNNIGVSTLLLMVEQLKTMALI